MSENTTLPKQDDTKPRSGSLSGPSPCSVDDIMCELCEMHTAFCNSHGHHPGELELTEKDASILLWKVGYPTPFYANVTSVSAEETQFKHYEGKCRYCAGEDSFQALNTCDQSCLK